MTGLRLIFVIAVVIATGSLQACSCSGKNGANGDDTTDPDGLRVPDGGVCPVAGEHSCNNECTNTQIDPNNCGTCGNACTGTQVCVSSGCTDTCPMTLEKCNGTCTDFAPDNANCGSCGN